MFKTFCGQVSTRLSSISRYIPLLPCKLSIQAPVIGNLQKNVGVHVASTYQDTQKNLHCGSGSRRTRPIRARPIRIPRAPRTIVMTQGQVWVMYGVAGLVILSVIYTIPASIRSRKSMAKLNGYLEEMEKEDEEREKKSLRPWYSVKIHVFWISVTTYSSIPLVMYFGRQNEINLRMSICK